MNPEKSSCVSDILLYYTNCVNKKIIKCQIFFQELRKNILNIILLIIVIFVIIKNFYLTFIKFYNITIQQIILAKKWTGLDYG